MAHITNKRRIQKERNNRNRGVNGFNTGTRDIGKSKIEKVAEVHLKLCSLY